MKHLLVLSLLAVVALSIALLVIAALKKVRHTGSVFLDQPVPSNVTAASALSPSGFGLIGSGLLFAWKGFLVIGLATAGLGLTIALVTYFRSPHRQIDG